MLFNCFLKTPARIFAFFSYFFPFNELLIYDKKSPAPRFSGLIKIDKFFGVRKSS